MRVLHVIGSYPPTTFSTGPPAQVHSLVRELRSQSVDARVVTTDANGPTVLDVPAGRWETLDGVPVFYGHRVGGTTDFSPQAWRAIVEAARASDVIHVTGLFSWMNLLAASVSRRRRVPVVVSPRGSFDPAALAFSPWKKRLYAAIGGARAVREAAGYHVSSEREAAEVRAAVPGARVGIVPNGVAIPERETARPLAPDVDALPVVLYLGRIHRVKNLPVLARAFSFVHARHPSARLVFAGRDDRGHQAELERVLQEVGIGACVEFTGHLDGAAAARQLSRATVLVLPSVTENFGNVVAEALAHELPVIASTGTPWGGLVEHGCGWWVEPEERAMAGALDAALSESPDRRRERGRRGRAWMIESFSWPSVARKMAEFYVAVVRGEGGAGR